MDFTHSQMQPEYTGYPLNQTGGLINMCLLKKMGVKKTYIISWTNENMPQLILLSSSICTHNPKAGSGVS